MPMWKSPNRPNHEITQPFNSGIVTVYSASDSATPGYCPKEKLSFKISLRYEEQRLGVQRYYAGMQNQIQIERVIRVPRAGRITNQDVAVTEDGRRYRIDLIQSVVDTWPPCIDLALTKIEQEDEAME